MISQQTLERYVQLRSMRLAEEKKIKDKYSEEEHLKRELTKAIEDGKEFERGAYTAEMKPQGRFPDWKSEFIAVAGEGAVEEVLAKTPYRMILSVAESME